MTATRTKPSIITDPNGIRRSRAPWESGPVAPDLRPETAPRRSVARAGLPALSISERIAILKRAITEVAAEGRDHG